MSPSPFIKSQGEIDLKMVNEMLELLIKTKTDYLEAKM